MSDAALKMLAVLLLGIAFTAPVSAQQVDADTAGQQQLADEYRELERELERLAQQLPSVLAPATELEEKRRYVDSVLQLRERLQRLETEITEQRRSDAQDKTVADEAPSFVLTGISYIGDGEHRADSLGYLRRTEHAAAVELEAVYCEQCPQRIGLGESARFAARNRIRMDLPAYDCGNVSTESLPRIPLINMEAFFGRAAAEGAALQQPDCGEGDRSASASTVSEPPPGITLQGGVALAAALESAGSAARGDSGTVYFYDSHFSSDGTLGAAARQQGAGLALRTAAGAA